MARNTDENLRPIIPFKIDNMDENVLQYVAGFCDADSCFNINETKGNHTVQFSISQSLKGIKCLHYIYDNFGGSINIQLKENETRQRAYSYTLNGDDAVKFAKTIENHLLIKKRDASRIADFPIVSLHIIPIIATNTINFQTIFFDTLKACQQHFGTHLAFNKKEIIKYRDWEIRKSLSEAQITDIKRKRMQLFEELKLFRDLPHDSIPAELTPSIAYCSGFFDGDGRIMTNGKSGQNHSISQKYPDICNLFKRTFGGTVCRSRHCIYSWEIYTGAELFMESIAPYLVGKKEQASLVLNMQPGQAMNVAIALRALKGKGNPKTPRMDRHRLGIPAFKTTIRDLPRGVFKDYGGTRYRAQIQYNNRLYIIGHYYDPQEAHDRYCEARKRIIMCKAAGQQPDLSDYRLSISVRGRVK